MKEGQWTVVSGQLSERKMVLIVGMAKSGLAAARLLRSRDIEVFATDSNQPSLAGEFERIGVPYETGGHTLSRFLDADEIVVSPGVPSNITPLTEAVGRGVSIVSELEVASRYLKGDIVAITGSNGKTTTTTLVGEMLGAGERPVQVGGNIGTPVSDLVTGSAGDTINVLEVSSFQLEGIVDFKPRVGVLLNVTPDHLDRYADFDAYRLAKFKVFHNQAASDFAVVNRDDPQCFPVPVNLESTELLFSQHRSLDSGASREGDDLLVHGSRFMSAGEVPLRGRHNVDNVLAAALVASTFGVRLEQIASTIRTFRPVEHRLETVATIDGVEFVNDSKATNVDSAVKAFESFEQNVIAIVGGKDKGASYEPLIEAMGSRVKHVLLIGASAGKLEDAIAGRVPTSRTSTMTEAVEKSIGMGQPGDIVLLVPACASFDMFESYEERGRAFKHAVLSHVEVR